MRAVAFVVVVLVATLAAAASGAPTEIGVSATTVTIGGTFPLTGPASQYAPVPVAMKAYFSYVNDRRGTDGKRGVGGRRIVFDVYDDGYNPANSVQLTRRLVEQDKVFAVVGSVGTEVNLAVRPYLNARKVPQLLNATGATIWGTDQAEYPWTIGWSPPYTLEAKIYGHAIARNSPGAKARTTCPASRPGLAQRPPTSSVRSRTRSPTSRWLRRWRSCVQPVRRCSSSSRRRSSRSRRTWPPGRSAGTRP